jgi:RNA polymerase sigma-70 factor (ECF subfamily)
MDFESVAKELGPALWRLTAAYAAHRADREDLYQEILAAVWQALPRFEGRASLRTYVLRIGHNRGLRHRARRERLSALHTESDDDIAAPGPGADERLEQSLQRERLTKAIGQLSPALAQTVTLSLEGLSHAEIAEVLGITDNNVGVRMNRAREALARLLRTEAA